MGQENTKPRSITGTNSTGAKKFLDAAEICLILEKSEHFSEIHIRFGEFELKVIGKQSPAAHDKLSPTIDIPALPENFEETKIISEEFTKAALEEAEESFLMASSPSDYEAMQVDKHLVKQRVDDAKA